GRRFEGGERPPSAGEIEPHGVCVLQPLRPKGEQPQRLLEVCVAYPQLTTQAGGEGFAGRTTNFAEFSRSGSSSGDLPGAESRQGSRLTVQLPVSAHRLGKTRRLTGRTGRGGAWIGQPGLPLAQTSGRKFRFPARWGNGGGA